MLFLFESFGSLTYNHYNLCFNSSPLVTTITNLYDLTTYLFTLHVEMSQSCMRGRCGYLDGGPDISILQAWGRSGGQCGCLDGGPDMSILEGRG